MINNRGEIMILSYIWFENQNQFTEINFSTKHFITYNHEENTVDSSLNEFYIKDFYSKNITSVLGVVGKNASGKTSLFKCILEIINGSFENDYFIVYEDQKSDMLYYSTNVSQRINSNNKKKFSSVNKHSDSTNFFLLTNIVDNNSLFFMDEGFINLSKTYLMSNYDSLEKFFDNEMHSNIQFSAMFNDNLQIKEYINLPKEIDVKIEEQEHVNFHRNDLFYFVSQQLEKENKGDEYLGFLTENTLDALHRAYETVMNTYSYIDYKYFEDVWFYENIFQKNKNIVSTLKKLGIKLKDIICLNIEEKKDFDDDIDYDEEIINYKELDEINKLTYNIDNYPKEALDESTLNKLRPNLLLKEQNITKDEVPSLKDIEKFISLIYEWEDIINLLKTQITKSSDLNFSNRYIESEDYSIKFMSICLRIDIITVKDLQTTFDGFSDTWKEFFFFYYSWRNLSSGENSFLTLFSRLYENRDQLRKNNIILIDEGDTSFHPEWQQKWMNIVINVLDTVFPKSQFQLIISTHSPFILSDISSKDTLLLANGEKIKADGLTLSFGSSIHDLLTNAFFINNGLVGEFAKNKINSIIDLLLGNEFTQQDLITISKIKELIAEPIVRKKVTEIYNEKAGQIETVNERVVKIETELELLREELENLKNDT